MSIEDKLYNLLKYYEKSPDFFRKIIARLYNLIPESKRLGENYTYFKKLIPKGLVKITLILRN